MEKLSSELITFLKHLIDNPLCNARMFKRMKRQIYNTQHETYQRISHNDYTVVAKVRARALKNIAMTYVYIAVPVFLVFNLQ